MRPPPLLRGARLLSVAGARPSRVVGGTELGATFGRSADWIRTRTGIRELRRLGPGENLVDLALTAGRRALAKAGVEVDVVLTASCSSTPAVDEQLRAQLLPRRPQVGLNAACSGFSYGLASADALVRTGQAENVLVLAAEQMSRHLDPDDLATSIVFGDGAGAAVVGATTAGQSGIGPVVWGSDGDSRGLIACDDQAPFALRMQGQAVFRWAVETATRVAAEACRRAEVKPGDIDVFVPHQANLRIVDAVVKALDLRHAVTSDDICTAGNTSAASIPLGLSALMDRGTARAGQLALLVGFGAGLAFAAQVVRLP